VLSVEVLTSYSHTPQLAELQRCAIARRSDAVAADPSSSNQPWGLGDRLDEHTHADMMAAYQAGSTAASLAVTHSVSVRSVKRLMAAAGVRRRRLPALN
jgi:hypothetical protein